MIFGTGDIRRIARSVRVDRALRELRANRELNRIRRASFERVERVAIVTLRKAAVQNVAISKVAAALHRSSSASGERKPTNSYSQPALFVSRVTTLRPLLAYSISLRRLPRERTLSWRAKFSEY